MACACFACNDDPAAEPVDDARLPCAVSELLEQNCARCHGDPLREGAPTHLLRASDFGKRRGTTKIADIVAARIRDEMRPMPPSGLLPRAQQAVLRDWIERGAPADADGCEVETPAHDAGADAGHPHAPSTPRDVEPSDWPSFGGDLMSTRANLQDHAISAENVGSLARIWQLDTSATSSTPLAIGGVTYVPTWGGEVHALAIADGEQLYEAKLPALIDSSAAASESQLFVSDARGSLHALARETGELLWSQLLDEHPNVHLWSSPIYIPDADLVVVGVASYEEVTGASPLTFRGSLVALDAQDGHERWRFYTTAANDQEGTGVAIWSTAAVDSARKLIYIGTGNNYAAPGSPLSDSMLAIDYVSGSLVWSHQFLSEDVFSIVFASGPDYDIGSTANLFTAGGRDLVGIGIKSGLFAALDRDDGTLVWTTQVAPGGLFGGIISPSAYADGALYVLCNDETVGEVAAAALDAETGKPIWERRFPGQSFSGVAYVNGLVYVGTIDGTLSALAAASGEIRWSDVLPDAVGSPVVADGTLLVTFGYSVTLGSTEAGKGGVIAYAPGE